jgi:hypothetical protein
MLKFFDSDPVTGFGNLFTLDQGSGMENSDTEFRINIPDLHRKFNVNEKKNFMTVSNTENFYPVFVGPFVMIHNTALKSLKWNFYMKNILKVGKK